MARTSFKILTKSICFNAIFSSFSIPTKPSKHLLSTFPFRISLFHPSLLPLQTCKTTRQFLQIHAHFIVSGLFQDPFAASRILKFVADSGDIAYTALIFQQMELPDTFSVNTIIKVYSQSSNPSRAVVFYFDMRQKGFFFPNSYTFPPLENSCAKEGCSDNGKKCHGQALKIGVDEDIHVRNALVHMYASCGLVGCARQVFDGMLQRDLVSWNSMVNGYVKMGDLVNARQMFDEMPKRNVISWNVMIAGYLKGRNPGSGLKLFREMGRAGVKGSITTMVSVVTACGRSARLKKGRSVHGFWVRNFMETSLIFDTALVDMYSKCGKAEIARIVFDGMLERNLVCWNAMILGQCIHGSTEDGLALFEDMVGKGSRGKENDNDSQQEEQGISPDEVTFVGVLCACFRAGLLTEGRKYFYQMSSVYNVTPKFAHYWCMANLYGAAGHFQEAEEVLKSMPEELESLVWSSLLGLCRFNGDVELGEQIARHLIEVEPSNRLPYALLWNVYAVAGRWEDVAKVKSLIVESGVKTTVGSSLLDLNEIVHEFKVGDRSQPELEKIYKLMDELAGRPLTGRKSLDPVEF